VRLRASIARLTEWCRDGWRRRLRPLFVELNSKLRGYYQYYGVYGNYRSLKQFYTASTKILFKWLNRRSQRRRFTWAGFSEVLKRARCEKTARRDLCGAVGQLAALP